MCHRSDQLLFSLQTRVQVLALSVFFSMHRNPLAKKSKKTSTPLWYHILWYHIEISCVLCIRTEAQTNDLIYMISYIVWYHMTQGSRWIFAVWATDHFWIMERLALAPSGGPARTSEGCFSETRPSSQPPSLPKFNFGTALPTWCTVTNYSVLPNAASGHGVSIPELKMSTNSL